MQKLLYRATGRRKAATVDVILMPGDGEKILVKKRGSKKTRTAEEYFQNPVVRDEILKPLAAVGALGNFDVYVTACGGGLMGQIDAVKMAIARALLLVDSAFRMPLKKAGFLRRDARKVERKKYGLKKARRAPQFSKR